MPSLPALDCLQPRAEDTVSTPRTERAATPIGEYRRLTTSEGALSHRFLPAMGTRVATRLVLASFRRPSGGGYLAAHPVPLALTCHAPGCLWLGLEAAVGNSAAAIDAKPVAAFIQPAKRLEYEHTPGFSRGQYRLGAI